MPRALRAKLFANSAPLMGVADGVVLAEQTAKGDKAAMLAAVTKLGAKIYDGRTEPRAVGTVTCISHTTERLKDDVITVKFDAVTLHLKRQSKHWKHYRPVLQDDDEENSAAAASPPLQSPAKRPRFAPKEIYKPEEPQHISKDDLMAMKHVAEAAIAAAAAAGAPPADPFGHDATVERIRAGYIAYQAAIDAGNREAAWEALLTFCRACFCYAELVRSIAAASLGPFCEEVFPLLRPKGSWMEMLASFGQVSSRSTCTREDTRKPSASCKSCPSSPIPQPRSSAALLAPRRRRRCSGRALTTAPRWCRWPHTSSTAISSLPRFTILSRDSGAKVM